jgi:cytochrome b
MAHGRTILVWDVPTRLFHWLLVASFAGAFATGESERWRDLHVVLGYTAGGLIAFRLLWGLVGTRYARFSSLPLSPQSVLRYLKSLRSGAPEHHAGHNPAGSWAILGLLGLVAATAASGWAVFAKAGPEWLQGVHEALSSLTVALVLVHVTAVIASSLLHRENLVRAMLTGFKRGAASEAPAEGANWLVGALLLGAVATLWSGWLPLGAEGTHRNAAETSAQGQHEADD